MKKLLSIALLAIFFLVACNSAKKEAQAKEEALIQKIDSLTTVMDSLKTEIDSSLKEVDELTSDL